MAAELSASVMNFKHFALQNNGAHGMRPIGDLDPLGYGILGVSKIMNAWLMRAHSWPSVQVQAEYTVPVSVQHRTISHFVTVSKSGIYNVAFSACWCKI